MQRILFPMKVMKITTGINEATHVYSNAIDIAGRDAGIENVYAPFDGIIKKVWPANNTVWLESLEPVLFADGTEDFATVMLTHDNDVRDLWAGKRIAQGEAFYQEGVAGMAFGNHVHMEIARGKFKGTGWFLNKGGYWALHNSVPPWTAFWLGSDVEVINGYGYTWQKEKNMKIASIEDVIYAAQFKLGQKWSEKDAKNSGYVGQTYESVEQDMSKWVSDHGLDFYTVKTRLENEVTELKKKLGAQDEGEAGRKLNEIRAAHKQLSKLLEEV